VVTGGTLPDGLGDDYSKVHIGLPYDSDIETLKPEIAIQSGTTQNRKIKISQVTLRVINSRGGKIGPDFDTLYDLRNNFVNNYNVAIDLYSGDLKDVLGGGMSDEGRFCLRQSDPLPFTLAAILPSVSLGGVSGQ